LYLNGSVISSSNFPFTYAGEAVEKALMQFLRVHLVDARRHGVEWIE
jgi:hypothetical protein